jgi:hypothetical protein
MVTFSSGVKCFRSFLKRSLRYLNERTLSPFQLRRDSLRFTAMISVSPGAWRGVNNPGMSTEDGKVEKQSLFPAEHHIKNKDQLSERKNF